MASVGKLFPPLSGIGIVTSLLTKKKKKADDPAPAPTISRNMAAEAARREDVLRRRRGVGANELTRGGAEAVTPGGKTLLGQ